MVCARAAEAVARRAASTIAPRQIFQDVDGCICTSCGIASCGVMVGLHNRSRRAVARKPLGKLGKRPNAKVSEPFWGHGFVRLNRFVLVSRKWVGEMSLTRAIRMPPAPTRLTAGRPSNGRLAACYDPRR
jgi:hypothetical protein